MVELLGSGFEGGAQVRFGKTVSPQVQVLSPNQIKASTPPGEALGFVDVSVSVGAESQRLDSAFEYIPNFPDIDLDHLGADGAYLTGLSRDAVGFGASFADLNGDGIEDLIDCSSRNGTILVGVLHGAPDIEGQIPAFTPSDRVTVIFTPETDAIGHFWASPIGDVNGDGIEDLWIGQQEAFGFIVFGRHALPQEVNLDEAVDAGQAVRVTPGAVPGVFTAVALGDLTGDGVDDFAVAMSQGDGVLTFLAGQLSWPHQIDLRDSRQVFSRIHGSRLGQGFGWHLAAAGDVNGDGLKDFLVDAGQGSGDIFIDALAFIIYGAKDLPLDTEVEGYIRGGGGVEIKPPSPAIQGSLFNIFTFSGPGDVNGDHYADILLSQGGGGRSRQGESYLIFGGEKLPGFIELLEDPSTQDGIVRILGEASERNAGVAGAAGDFNNDGFRDFLIGEKMIQNAAATAGNVFLILGGKQLPSAIELDHLGGLGIKIRSPEFGGIGASAGPFGDLNGDGQSDFVLGAFAKVLLDQPVLDESRLYIVFGPYGEKKFIRGDANRDGVLDIADAVTILAYLYTGGERPTCIDALDVDDSGLLDITDAVRLLSFLFLGGDAPPSPFPAEGLDTTKDVLDCLGFIP
jgi:hypothetical protein